MKNKNAALVALMEEYWRAARDYFKILETISDTDFVAMRDEHTKDPDCHSIQTITFHLVSSGYTYANYLHALTNGAWQDYKTPIDTGKNGIEELKKMLHYTDDCLEGGLWYQSQAELDAHQIEARWGSVYELEQLLEHAIVHILRHRRQVERFLSK